VDEAWKLATGKGVTIADCDAGYYVNETEIAENLLMEFAKDLSDKDAPTVVNDGNFVSHGTSVAAIMVVQVSTASLLTLNWSLFRTITTLT